MESMGANIFAALADNHVFNELLNGMKPCCAIYSSELATFARNIDLDVQLVKNNSYQFYSISYKNNVETYFQIEDVTGIINTKLARTLYRKIKNTTPASAFKILQFDIWKNGETLEVATINGLLCGYAVCDIVEYLIQAWKFGIRKTNIHDRAHNYYSKSASDYRIQHILCAYCRKQYMKNRKVW